MVRLQPTLILIMSNPWIISLLAGLTAYLIGSINFSILLFKVLGKGDPRSNFSGNPGTTNVYRQAGLFWAIIVLVLDMGRAIAVAYLALRFLKTDWITWAGLFLILGNRFPCFHGFKGGKGVANFLGFSLILTPWSALVSGISWVLVNYVLKTPFIASFAMVAILSIGTILRFEQSVVASSGTTMTALVIFISHYKNVVGYFSGQQTKVSS